VSSSTAQGTRVQQASMTPAVNAARKVQGPANKPATWCRMPLVGAVLPLPCSALVVLQYSPSTCVGSNMEWMASCRAGLLVRNGRERLAHCTATRGMGYAPAAALRASWPHVAPLLPPGGARALTAHLQLAAVGVKHSRDYKPSRSSATAICCRRRIGCNKHSVRVPRVHLCKLRCCGPRAHRLQ